MTTETESGTETTATGARDETETNGTKETEGQETTGTGSAAGESGDGDTEGQDGQEQQGDSDEVKQLKAALAAERKAVADARKETAELKRASMSEAEQAVAAARDEGRATALKEVGSTMAEAKFRAAAAGKVSDVDQAVALTGDMGRFVSEDGTVDDAAISEAVEGFAKLAPPAKQGGGGSTARKGVGEGGSTESDDWMRSVLRH